MTQSLHIFRKDIRHQWLDLVLYITVLVLFAVFAPLVRNGVWVGNPALPLFVSLLTIVIALSWFTITLRLVHEESLVGDRQFWTTRPYRWQSLLAAKALFLALCVALPYLLMQLILAADAGLSPLNEGFVLATLKHTLNVWLPMFLIATVTATVASAFFSAIGVAILWGAALTFVLGRDEPRTDAPYAFAVLSICFAALFAGILLHQYRSRDTQGTRIALLSCVALFFFLFLGYVQMGFPFIGNAVMHLHYPNNAAPEVHPVFNSNEPRPSIDVPKNMPETQAAILLPIHLEGLDGATRLIDLNVAFTAEANGRRYSSPWRPMTLNSQGTTLLIPRAFVHDAAGSTTHLHLELTGALLKPADTHVAIVSDRFRISPNSMCNRIDLHGSHIRCTFAYDVPDPIRVEPIAAPECAASLQSANVRTEEAGTVVDPVRVEILSLGERTNCNVTSVRATTYRRAKNFSTTLDMPSLNLSDYVAH